VTLLSRKADYALLILSYLYGKPVGGNARSIAEQFGLSRPFVANILKELCQKGFVTSHRGVKGGYALARPANSISLAELLETVEDGFRLTTCSPSTHAGSDTCSMTDVCTIHGPMAEVHQRLVGVLRGVTLAELFDPATPKPSALPMLSVGGCCGGTRTLAATPA
jgi:Rrf2 family transcriptional regulator, cysteine metabolism repressor